MLFWAPGCATFCTGNILSRNPALYLQRDPWGYPTGVKAVSVAKRASVLFRDLRAEWMLSSTVLVAPSKPCHILGYFFCISLNLLTSVGSIWLQLRSSTAFVYLYGLKGSQFRVFLFVLFESSALVCSRRWYRTILWGYFLCDTDYFSEI